MPYKDRQRQLDAIERVRQRNLAYIRNAKAKPCTDCGVEYPYYVMQFDHIRDKKHNVNMFRNNIASLLRIQEEIDKCEVVCANCHAARTWNRIASKSKWNGTGLLIQQSVGSSPTEATILKNAIEPFGKLSTADMFDDMKP